jgi:hypothetical protein
MMKLAAQKKAASLNGWDASGALLCKKLQALILKHKNN